MKTIFLTIFASLLFLVFAFYFSGTLIEWLLPGGAKEHYGASTVSGPFKTTILFSLAIALIPLFLLFTWRLAPITSLQKRMASIAIAITAVGLGIVLRQQMLRSYFSRSLTSIAGYDLNASFPLNKVHFEFYILGGLIIGCIVSALYLKDKKL
ncbi:MAG: hypothetical protein QM687_10010 [Ferruginibacter sp.]